jgi:prepilin-type N-terminal cleavage/methylation domain-containing protein
MNLAGRSTVYICSVATKKSLNACTGLSERLRSSSMRRDAELPDSGRCRLLTDWLGGVGSVALRCEDRDTASMTCMPNRLTADLVPTGSLSHGDGSPGFTLVELVVVVAVLAVVAGLAIVNVAGVRRSAEGTVATATLRVVRDAICGTDGTPGYLADMKYVPGFAGSDMRLHHLLAPPADLYPAFTNFDSVAQRGWRGPYARNVQPVQNAEAARAGLFPAAGDRRWPEDETFQARGFYAVVSGCVTSWYGTAGLPALADPWGNPIVLQVPQAAFGYARLVSAGPDGVLRTPCSEFAPTNRGDDVVLFLNRADVYETH